MLKMIHRGDYKLFQSEQQTKILILDETDRFSWDYALDIENTEELAVSSKLNSTGAIIASGKYRSYEVKNEKGFTEKFHLELSVGCGHWQGYVLPHGLPNDKERCHIIPTKEVITKTNSCSKCNCGC